MQIVITEDRGPVRHLILNRPEKRNAMNAEMILALGEAIERHPNRDECVRVRLDQDEAFATGPQGSHILSSMTLADALAVIPRGEGSLAAGSQIELLSLQP